MTQLSARQWYAAFTEQQAQKMLVKWNTDAVRRQRQMCAQVIPERCCECNGSGAADMQDWDDPRAFRKRICRKCGGAGFVEVAR